MIIRIATWNIAGARKQLSSERFDYSTVENVDYFTEHLRKLNLDIVCLQESHVNANDSLAKRIAEKLDMPYVAETPGCPSHINPTFNLTTAILSKKPFKNASSILLPKSTFELKFVHNEKVVQPYDRYAQIMTFENFDVATMHSEPLIAFGMSYDEGIGKDFAHEIDIVLKDAFVNPLIFAADFNVHLTADAFPLLVNKFHLHDALPDEPTKPNNDIHPDHILYSPEFQVNHVGVTRTASDHFLCWAELTV